jgi:hypothetical protein
LNKLFASHIIIERVILEAVWAVWRFNDNGDKSIKPDILMALIHVMALHVKLYAFVMKAFNIGINPINQLCCK